MPHRRPSWCRCRCRCRWWWWFQCPFPCLPLRSCLRHQVPRPRQRWHLGLRLRLPHRSHPPQWEISPALASHSPQPAAQEAAAGLGSQTGVVQSPKPPSAQPWFPTGGREVSCRMCYSRAAPAPGAAATATALWLLRLLPTFSPSSVDHPIACPSQCRCELLNGLHCPRCVPGWLWLWRWLWRSRCCAVLCCICLLALLCSAVLTLAGSPVLGCAGLFCILALCPPPIVPAPGPSTLPHCPADFCYRTVGMPRAACDQGFLNNMRAECSRALG